MTQASFPFENIDTTETQFSKWARHFNNGVNDEPTGDALEVSVGTGLAVNVEAGEAMVRGHYYTSDATESLSLTTADASNDRIDTVVLRLDPVANSIVLAVRAGTPAGSPVAPTLVQTDAGVFEQPLANVLVPATSGVPTTITDRREFMGTRLGSWSTAGRPDPAGRVLFGFNTSLGVVEFYNVGESEWQTVGGFADSDTPAYRYVDTVTFASSGTFTKADYSWLRAIRVTVIGAGAGAGGVPATVSGESAIAGSGGGGGGCETFITDIAGLSASETITVGAGGTGGTAGGTGTNGSDSVAFGATAEGGFSGGGGVSSAAILTIRVGGINGRATGTFDRELFGNGSKASILIAPGVSTRASTGSPGTSALGGQLREAQDNEDSTAGVTPGEGARAGASRANQSARDGASGAAGIVIIDLFA